MTIEPLRAAHQAQPFRPFVMHPADGRSVAVDHREFVMTVPSGRTAVAAQPDDTLTVIDRLLVADLEIKPAADGPGRRENQPGAGEAWRRGCRGPGVAAGRRRGARRRARGPCRPPRGSIG